MLGALSAMGILPGTGPDPMQQPSYALHPSVPALCAQQRPALSTDAHAPHTHLALLHVLQRWCCRPDITPNRESFVAGPGMGPTPAPAQRVCWQHGKGAAAILGHDCDMVRKGLAGGSPRGLQLQWQEPTPGLQHG
jgi:hypothetical protein